MLHPHFFPVISTLGLSNELDESFSDSQQALRKAYVLWKIRQSKEKQKNGILGAKENTVQYLGSHRNKEPYKRVVNSVEKSGYEWR